MKHLILAAIAIQLAGCAAFPSSPVGGKLGTASALDPNKNLDVPSVLQALKCDIDAGLRAIDESQESNEQKIEALKSRREILVGKLKFLSKDGRENYSLELDRLKSRHACLREVSETNLSSLEHQIELKNAELTKIPDLGNRREKQDEIDWIDEKLAELRPRFQLYQGTLSVTLDAVTVGSGNSVLNYVWPVGGADVVTPNYNDTSTKTSTQTIVREFSIPAKPSANACSASEDREVSSNEMARFLKAAYEDTLSANGPGSELTSNSLSISAGFKVVRNRAGKLAVSELIDTLGTLSEKLEPSYTLKHDTTSNHNVKLTFPMKSSAGGDNRRLLTSRKGEGDVYYTLEKDYIESQDEAKFLDQSKESDLCPDALLVYRIENRLDSSRKSFNRADPYSKNKSNGLDSTPPTLDESDAKLANFIRKRMNPDSSSTEPLLKQKPRTENPERSAAPF